jgi:hypothetical protein
VSCLQHSYGERELGVYPIRRNDSFSFCETPLWLLHCGIGPIHTWLPHTYIQLIQFLIHPTVIVRKSLFLHNISLTIIKLPILPLMTGYASCKIDVGMVLVCRNFCIWDQAIINKAMHTYR